MRESTALGLFCVVLLNLVTYPCIADLSGSISEEAIARQATSRPASFHSCALRRMSFRMQASKDLPCVLDPARCLYLNSNCARKCPFRSPARRSLRCEVTLEAKRSGPAIQMQGDRAGEVVECPHFMRCSGGRLKILLVATMAPLANPAGPPEPSPVIGIAIRAGLKSDKRPAPPRKMSRS